MPKQKRSIDEVNNAESRDEIKKQKTAEQLNFPDEPEDSIYNRVRQGDLIFGLSEPTDEVVTKLKTKGFHHLKANSINNPVVRIVVKEEQPEKFALDQLQRDHYQFLSRHSQSLKREPGKTFPSMQDQPQIGAAIRRACKLLITKHENVHVVTKGISWERVCSKRKANGEVDHGVTNSEMRAAYRDYLRHGVNPHVFFYNNENKLDKLPWQKDENRQIWHEYFLEREQTKKQRKNKP